MKLYKLIIFSILYFALSGFTETVYKSGIDFYDGSFQEALDASAKTGKPIFIDVYATWCGPCKQLKRTSFKDKAVGEYYNKNFICLSIDGEKGEGPQIMKMYGINSYPTLLIVNSKAQIQARSEGFMKPYILINFGRRVIP